jgi:signal transduction histidine kinase/ActR/RegA family two-component response regulator
MRQHSSLPRQKCVKVASADTLSQTAMALEAASTWQLQMELQHERCFNRLGERLNECVTACLATTPFYEGTASKTEAEIFQTFAQELSTVLAGEQVAILCPTKDTETCKDRGDRSKANPARSSQACFTLSYIASGGSPAASLTPWIGASGKPVRLELGETFTFEDLQDLQTKAPENVWQISGKQSPWGWLLLNPSSASPPLNRSVSRAAQLKLIQRSIHQCTQALHQVRLIGRQFQKQQELTISNQELAQTNQLKSEFLANTSHEIRTPLSSILGFTHLLKVQGFSPTNLRHQEYLNIILASGQHLLALINDILDLSKIEANQLDLNWEVIDVQAVCQTALTLVREKASDKGLSIRLEIAPQISTLIADSLRLKQMLFNLLSNAVKFTLQGSVGIQVDMMDGFLRFAVWDTGTGISKEQQRLLFQPYSQIANAAVGHEQGTGLGLALTQKLVELHGGWVELVSEIDQGSRFTLYLPSFPSVDEGAATEIAQAHPENVETVQQYVRWQPLSQPTGNSPALNKRTADKPLLAGIPPFNRLLLVEDNIHNAKLMLTFLSKLGYEVTWVKDGTEMWRALERSQPALILMDIHLPAVDGLTLTRQLKSDERYQTIPIIAQTAMAMSGDRDLCLEAGAVSYISKPIDLDTLMQLVSQYVQGKDQHSV